MNDDMGFHGRMRASLAVLMVVVPLLTGSCGDTTAPDDSTGPDLLPGLIVSNPAVTGAEPAPVAYVSMLPGAYSRGLAATITNRRTGGNRTEALVAGGLDPVAMGAVVGDTIVVAIDTGGAQPVRLAKKVPAEADLVVVRTEPSAGRVDVPLDARLLIIFSEPVDPSSVPSEAAILQHAGSPVSGAAAVSPDAMAATFTPSTDLLAGANYAIVLDGVRATDGTELNSAAAVGFRTRAPNSFPSVPAGALTYVRVAEPGHPSDALVRYVLYEDGTFALQYVNATFGFFEFTGRYSEVKASIDFHFDANAGAWQATGTIKGDSLVVAYNQDMVMSDFEDGVYRLAPGEPEPPTTPAVRELAFTRKGDIYVVNADGSGIRQVTSGQGEDYEAAWSPDGTRIAFTRYRPEIGSPRWGEATIHVINADGTALVRLSAHGDSTYDAHPTWSPDGTRIAFFSRREHDADPFHANDSDIYVMNTDGTNPLRLTHHGALVFHPAWSPDGSRIAFWAWNTEAAAHSIYVMHTDGANLTPIVTGESAYAPAWSPDGSRILTRTTKCVRWTDPDPTGEGPYCAIEEGPHLTAVRSDGSAPVRLSDYVLRADWLAAPSSWSPDGNLVAFTQPGCGWGTYEYECSVPSYIEILRLSDRQVTRLTEGSSPNWRR